MTEPTYQPAALAAALAGKRRLALSDGTSIALSGAIVLDLDGMGVEALDRSSGTIRYDLDGDGLADQTSWIGKSDAFLFFDRDFNNTVTDARELDFSSDGSGGGSALEGLRAMDGNKDGIISALDARFADYRLWQDRNGNGVAEANEIQTLSAAGIRSISLSAQAYTATQSADTTGIVAIGNYTRTNGVAGTLADAVLTYRSTKVDDVPAIDFATATFDRKASRYRVSTKDGKLFVTAREGGAMIDARAGGSIGALTMSFKDRSVGMLSAIVLDLDGDGVTTTGRGKARGWFDMNGDGAPDEQGWVGRRDGLLVIDRNGDGMINNGSELSFLAEDGTAAGSLAALAKLDSDGNHKLDASDARFGELRVWIDANGNGVTDQGELKTLADLKIQSISLDQKAVADKGRPGDNLTLATTIFTYANGMSRTAGDIALAFRPSQPVDLAAAPLARLLSGPDVSGSEVAPHAWLAERRLSVDDIFGVGPDAVMSAGETGHAGADAIVGERDRSLWAQASTLIGVMPPGSMADALKPDAAPTAIVLAPSLLAG